MTSIDLTFTSCDEILPTMPGKVSGVIEHDPHAHWVKVQCAVCRVLISGSTILAVGQCKFWPDAGTPGHTTYRRCRDCRDDRLHPEGPTND